MLTERQRQLWEIDENLCRAELTELERGEHLAERKRLYEEEHPETKQGGLPGAPGGGKAKTDNLAGFASDTEQKVGIDERTVRRSVRRATNIDKKVRDRPPRQSNLRSARDGAMMVVALYKAMRCDDPRFMPGGCLCMSKASAQRQAGATQCAL